jgi:hypothetical protein
MKGALISRLGCVVAHSFDRPLSEKVEAGFSLRKRSQLMKQRVFVENALRNAKDPRREARVFI